MALIEFKDYPDTTTPTDAENLNNNFNELNNKINTDIQNVQNSIPTYGKPIIYSGNSVDTLKNYIVNNAPAGAYMMHCSLNGAVYGAIVSKASTSYLTFILFSYSTTAKQYKYLNGTWSEINL